MTGLLISTKKVFNVIGKARPVTGQPSQNTRNTNFKTPPSRPLVVFAGGMAVTGGVFRGSLEMTIVELWSWTIPKFPLYQLSDRGRIRNKLTGNVLKPQKNHKGYPKVGLWANGRQKWFFVHRLVAIAFHLNPENKPCVNHKDGCKTNNHPGNLEWCTYLENMQHAYATGLKNMDNLEEIHRKRKERTHCKRGHEWNGIDSRGRFCKTCRTMRDAARYRSRKLENG